MKTVPPPPLREQGRALYPQRITSKQYPTTEKQPKKSWNTWPHSREILTSHTMRNRTATRPRLILSAHLYSVGWHGVRTSSG